MADPKKPLSLGEKLFSSKQDTVKEEKKEPASVLDLTDYAVAKARGKFEAPKQESHDPSLGKIGDSGWDNFREGLQQGKQMLTTGFGYTVGEALDRVGADELGKKVKRGASAEARKVYDPDDSWGQFFGSLVPSTVPTAGAIAAAPFTGGGSLLGAASILGLSSSAAGNGMMEYEAYQKSKGREVDENKKLAVGLAYGAAEGVMERFQLSKLMPKGVTDKAGKFLFKGNVKAAEEAGEGILEAYRKNNPSNYKSLMKKLQQGATTEGAEEVGTELAQFATDYLYHDLEDRPELVEQLPKNLGMAMLGGSIMGTGLGPLSYGSQNLTNQKRRRAQGEVILAQHAESGEAYEVLGTNEKKEGQELTYQVMDKYGEVAELPKSQIGEVARLTPDQFDKLLQDKLDSQEHERANRKPKTLATYGDQQVEVVAPGEKEGRVYVQLPDGSQKSVMEEELEDVTQISADEQILGEGREIVDDPVEPVEATRDKQQVIETEDGDFLYPGDEGYEEASTAQTNQQEQTQKRAENTQTIDIGKGDNARRVYLTPDESGEGYELSGLREVGKNSEPVDRTIAELTEDEKEDIAKNLNKTLESRGMQAITEPSDPDEPLSPSLVRVYKKDSEAMQAKKLDSYQVKADGAKVSVVNTQTGEKVGPGSKYYLPKVKQYFSENAPGYSQMERIADNDPNVSEQNYLSEVASRSENPVEIAEAYELAMEKAESGQDGAIKELAIANALNGIENLSRKQLEGRGLDKIYKGIAYANYAPNPNAPSTETMGLDELSEILTDQLGQAVTIDDIMEFIQDNPGGPSSVLNQKDKAVKKLEDAFREVTGAEISPALARSITESNMQSQGQSDTQPEGDSASQSEFENVADEDLPETGAQNFTAEIAELEQQLKDEGVTDEEIESIKQEADELTGEEIEALESEVEAEESTELSNESEEETTPVEGETGEVPGQGEVAEGGAEVSSDVMSLEDFKEGTTVGKWRKTSDKEISEATLKFPDGTKDVAIDLGKWPAQQAIEETIEDNYKSYLNALDNKGVKLPQEILDAYPQFDPVANVVKKANTMATNFGTINPTIRDYEKALREKDPELADAFMTEVNRVLDNRGGKNTEESTGQSGGANIVDDVDEVASEDGEGTGVESSIEPSPDSDTRSEQLKDKEAKIDEELSDLFDEFDDLSRGQANIGIDPKMIQISGKIIAKGAELGYVKIQQFADWVINNKGADFWRRIFPNFKAAYSANLSMQGNPNDEDLNAIAKSTADDYISDETAEQPTEATETETTEESSGDAVSDEILSKWPESEPGVPESTGKKPRDFTVGDRVIVVRGAQKGAEGVIGNKNEFSVKISSSNVWVIDDSGSNHAIKAGSVINKDEAISLISEEQTESGQYESEYKVGDKVRWPNPKYNPNAQTGLFGQDETNPEYLEGIIESEKNYEDDTYTVRLPDTDIQGGPVIKGKQIMSGSNFELVERAEKEEKPTRKRNTPLPQPKDGWRDNLIKARMYAADLGIPNQTADGKNKSKEELVAEIDAYLSEETTEGSTPKARMEISHGLKQEGESAFQLLSEFVDLKNIPEGHYKGYGGKGDAIMPLTIERQRLHVRPKDTLVDPDAYYLIVEQYYIQNGDIMSDPRVDFLVYPNLGLAFPFSFTNSGMGVYEEYLDSSGFLSLKLGGVVDFLEDSWVPHITQSGLLDRPRQKPGAQSEETTAALNTEERLFVNALRGELVKGNQLNKLKLNDLAQRMGVMEGDKRIKELAEYAIIERARELADATEGVENVFQDMVNLYDVQPNLTARTSTSIRNQQYSTPAPISYLMGVYTNLHDGVAGFEPSAGNGLLTIAAGKNPSNVRVNEIDDDRLSMLRLQNFHNITEQDGTEVFEDLTNTQQAIITNPPFGATDARYQADVMGRDIELSKLEHVMAARALDTMRDDGKAAILIGGNDTFNDKGNRTGQDRSFFHFLHHYYHVEYVLNFGGNVFNKQGANFPTRIILINGRKDTPEGHAPLNTEGVNVITDLSTLYQQVEPYLTEANHEPILQTELDAGGRSSGNISGTDTGLRGDNEPGSPTTVSGEGSSGTDQGGGQSGNTDSGESTGDIRGGVRGEGSTEPDVDSDGVRLDGQQNEETEKDGQKESEGLSPTDEKRNTGSVRREKSKVDSKFTSDDIIDSDGGNIVYSPLSDSESITTEMPASMAFSVVKTLNQLADEVGNVDQYVVDKVGFESIDALYEALAGEQVDAVALSIYQAERGKAVIVGDQTGIGKGRVAATMIRYAKKRGLVPMFWTEDPKLFSDIHRDLVDIGVNYKPFMVNRTKNGKVVQIYDEKGKKVYRSEPKAKHTNILKNPKKALNFDYIATTYSQIQNESSTTKRNFLKSFASNSLLIMDESHNAAGASNTGEYMIDLLTESQGGVYLSATFAKRPDNIPLYAVKTDISDAAMSQDEMIEAIESGGVALQEILSSDLVKSGQMVRRQRSFKGVKQTWEMLGVDQETGTVDALGREQRKTYDETAEVLRDIITFQKVHVKPAIEDIAGDLDDGGFTQGTDKAGVDNQPFVSRIHHVVEMLLFAVKADAIADRTIEIIKSDRKPIIAIKSTMESVLDDTIGTGESIENLHFGHVLTRALDSVMKYRISDGISGEDTHSTLSIDELTPAGRQAYERITQKAMDITEDLPASPIDHIVNKVEKAGYHIGEVTGRDRKVVFDENGVGKAVARTSEESDKNTLFDKFNNDKTFNGLLINAAGSTGVSAHSSEKFQDQRQRVMIFHQPELNINTQVQKIGRIFRTGQVNLPEYQYITSAIPAEGRMMMVLKRKLKSLDANTTSSQKTSSGFMESSDFINIYGDEIVTAWLKDNPEVHQRLEKPIKDSEWDKVKSGALTRVDGIAMKTTGRLAFMPTAIQEAFYEEVIQSYDNYIESLNEMGENELVMDNVDLQAESLEKDIIVKGEAPGTPFGGNTYLEKIKAKVLRKPYKQDEIATQVKSELDGQKAQEYRDDLFDKAKRFYERREVDLIDQVRSSETYTTEEKTARIKDIEKQTKEEIKRLDRKSLAFIPGEVYVVPADSKGESGITNNGVFLGYSINTKANNPYSASAIKVRFAVNSSQRTISAPTSFNGFINSIISDSYHLSKHAKNNIWENWDQNLNNSGFETRHIISGNILQGLNKAGNKGQLIQYTTNDGAVKNGILMPMNMKEKDLKSLDSVRVKATEMEPIIFDLGKGGSVEMSGEVTIKKNYDNDYELDVPASKLRGKRFWDDDALLDLVDGDFVKKGNSMRAVIPIQNIGKVLAYLSNNHSIYADVSRNKLDKLNNIDDGPMFKRADSAPISNNTNKIADHLENLVSDWKSKDRITIARSEDDLPWVVSEYIKSKGGGISGVYLDGKVYVNAYLHSDIESAERTLLHETVGHLGFRGLLENMAANRDQYNQLYTDLTLSIYEAFKNDAEFQRISNKYEFDFRYNIDRSQAAEEFLAHMAERGDQAKSYVDRFIQLIKDALASMGFKTKLTRADIIDLITDMRRFVDSDFSVYNDGHIMRAAYKRDTSQPFFSELEQVLQSKLSGKGTAKSYKEQIEGFERKGDFRKAEIEWVGLYEWLEEQSGKLNREEVVGFVRDNNVQMEEVVKGDDFMDMKDPWLSLRDFLKEYDVDVRVDGDGTMLFTEGDNAIDREYDEVVELIDEEGGSDAVAEFDTLVNAYESVSKEEGQTKFNAQDLVLPGGMDYKEMLITLPDNVKEKEEEVNRRYNALSDKVRERTGVWNLYNARSEGVLTTEEEAELSAIDRLAKSRGNARADQFRGSHWEEPNVLAHVRFNTREGNMLFLEEIQSDWHQQGRKSGYKTAPDYQPHEYKASEIELTEAETQWVTTDIHGTERTVGKGVATTRDSAKEYFARYLTNLDKEIARNEQTINRDMVPDAPFKTTWHELVIKRMIRHAAENGFQKVGWAPGEVHNERYKLSNHVDSISVQDLDTEYYKVIAIIMKQGTRSVMEIDEEGVIKRVGGQLKESRGKNLSEVIGKDLSEKVINSDVGTKMEGVDLEIGGEGMKGFYDKMLPRYLNKYLKKWDSKLGVESISIGSELVEKDSYDPEQKVWVKDEVEKTQDIWSFPVTPDMMRSVLEEGQPMFKKQNVLDNPRFRKWFGDSKVVDDNGDPLVVYHGTSYNFDVFNIDRSGSNTNDHGQMGFFFTQDSKLASNFSRKGNYDGGNNFRKGANLIPAYLSLQNPYRMPARAFVQNYKEGIGKERRNNLISEGYDGVIIEPFTKEDSRAWEALIGGDDSEFYYPQYVVFESSQIKSATGNQGTFDPSNPNIMFKIEDGAENMPGYRQNPVKRWISELGGNPLQQRPHQFQKMWDGLLRSTQNKFIDGKRIQEGVVKEGGALSDQTNFVQDEENHYGRIEKLRTEVKDAFVDPLIKDMRELYNDKDVKYGDLRDYLEAKHAPERNADMYERNPEGGDWQSGVHDTEDKRVKGQLIKSASRTIREFEERGILGNLEKVAEHVYGMNRHTLRMQFIGGMISKERFGTLLNKYDYYVPLRGFYELQDIDPTLYSFDRKMEGRHSRAGDILSYVQAMSDTAIIQGETNRVKQTFLEFVKENYDRSDLFRIRNVFWRKTDEIDEDTGRQKWVATFTQPSTQDLLDGKVKRRLNPDKEQQLWDENSNIFEENIIKVQVDGRPVIIEVNKPHLARAFGNMDVEHMPKFLSRTATMMNWLRSVITQYSPEFGMRNLIRDSWTGLINVAIDQNITEAAKIVNPVSYAQAFKALRNYYRNGKFDDSEWGKAMRAYMKHGAITGYWQLNQVKDHTKQLRRAIERGTVHKGVDGIKVLGNFLDDYNRVLENIARVSAFKHLHYDKVTNPDTGKPYTAKQAANYARNLTVNFNRKGNSSGPLGTLYLFFNATVQGITRQVQPFFSEHTRIRNRAMSAPIVMGGLAFGAAEILRASLGKDDDEEWRYDKITDFTRHHNIILPNFFSDDEEDYLRIPLPYGYNVYWAAGDVANRFANGSANLWDSAIEMAAITIDAYNPVGTSSGESLGEASYKSLLPTLAKPGFELVTNTDFKGDKIKPEPFPFSVPDPESHQHYKYVATWAESAAKWLNSATGGDEVTEGYIDISPEHIEYMGNFVGGGPLKFIDGLAQTVENVYEDVIGLEDMELYDIYDIPFVRSFYGKVSKRKTRDAYIDNRQKIENLVSDMEHYYETNQVQKARDFREENSDMITLYNDMKAIEKQRRVMSKYLKYYYGEQQKGNDNATIREQINNVVESQHELYLEFNRMVNMSKGKAGRKQATQRVIEALQNEN